MYSSFLKIKSYALALSCLAFLLVLVGCKKTKDTLSQEKIPAQVLYPSDVLPFMEQWKILLGDGTSIKDLSKYEKEDFFYTVQEGDTPWVVYKTPNSGVTSRTSSNTRTELGQKQHWTATTGGNLTGTLKVTHVSTQGDARTAAGFSVVVGQIHSDDGHENEPLKIFYKKFPGHTKGAVYWNYEINTAGENAGRWDFSTKVWGYDMSYVSDTPDSYPSEPKEGIALGEEFRYEINVYEGMMHLSFSSEGHPTKTFIKNLLKSDFDTSQKTPQQVLRLYKGLGRDGVERPEAYTGEMQYFKQGAYNQVNGKDPEKNLVWNGGAEAYGGDIAKQYANGCYTEVWFKEATVGPGIPPQE